MKKKLVSILMSLMLLGPTSFALTACGETPKNNEPAQEEVVEPVEQGEQGRQYSELSQKFVDLLNNTTVTVTTSKSFSMGGGEASTDEDVETSLFVNGKVYDRWDDPSRVMYDEDDFDLTKDNIDDIIQAIKHLAQFIDEDAVSITTTDNGKEYKVELDLTEFLNKTITNFNTNADESLHTLLDQLIEDFGIEGGIKGLIAEVVGTVTVNTTIGDVINNFGLKLGIPELCAYVDLAMEDFDPSEIPFVGGMFGGEVEAEAEADESTTLGEAESTPETQAFTFNWEVIKATPVMSMLAGIATYNPAEDGTPTEYVVNTIDGLITPFLQMSFNDLVEMAKGMIKSFIGSLSGESHYAEVTPVEPVNDPVVVENENEQENDQPETPDEPDMIDMMFDMVLNYLYNGDVKTATVSVVVVENAQGTITSVAATAHIQVTIKAEEDEEADTEPLVVAEAEETATDENLIDATIGATVTFTNTGTTTKPADDQIARP